MARKHQFSDIDNIIAKRIKLRRLMLNMTQSDLAYECEVSFQQIQKYESGKSKISCSRLFKISRILNVPIEFFFENNNKIYKTESLELLVLYWKLPKNLRENMVFNLLKFIK